MKFIFRFMPVLATLFLFTSPAFSGTENKDTYTLGEVVVTADKEKSVESIGTVREIDSDEIQMKNAHTLNEAIELLPGVYIRTAADGIPRVDIRGFRSRHVLLLLDGIPFNSTFDGQFDPAIVPVENIAKIKVSYGSNSVLYGQGGMGGVINIITKKGKEGIHGEVGGEAGENDTYLDKASISGKKGKFDFFLSSSQNNSEGFNLSDDFVPTSLENGGKRQNSDREGTSFFGNLGFTPNDMVQLGLIASYGQGEFGKPQQTILRTDDPLFAKNPKYLRIDDYDTFSTQVSAKIDLPGPADIRGWYYYNQYNELENQYNDATYTLISNAGSYTQNIDTTIDGATIQTSVDMADKGFLTVSLNGEKQSFESSGTIYEAVTVTTGGGGGGGGGRGGGSRTTTTIVPRNFNSMNEVKLYTVSVEEELFRESPMGLVFGYSHTWFDREDAGSDSDGSYLIGTQYEIRKDIRVKGSFARKIRFPSIRQLYEEEAGNPLLTAERSKNWELGIEKDFSRVNTSLTGFYIDVKDFIEKVSPADIYVNNDRYKFYGMELAGSTQIVPALLLRAGYTLMFTKDESTQYDRDELQYRPKHKFTVDATYDFAYGITGYMDISYIANQYYYSDVNTSLKRELNDYAIVNLKLSKSLFDNSLSLYAGADNILDKDYEQSLGFPAAGRTIYGGFRYNF